jgi:hypothetical protein
MTARHFLFLLGLFCFLEAISQNTPVVALQPLDIPQLLAEDQQKSYDIRCAAPILVSYSIDNQWDSWSNLPNGDRQWQLTFQATDNIAGLVLLLKNMYIPKGASLRIENKDQSQIAFFTSKDNNSKGILTVGMLLGNQVTLTYFEPKAVFGKGHFEIFRIDQAYKKQLLPPQAQPAEMDRGGERNGFGFGTALACNLNINCAGTDTIRHVKRGVCRVMMILQEGTGFCTGTLLNNTEQDGKPYILTAFHCQDGYTPLYDFWKFDFHYESGNCNNPSKEPLAKRLTGCVRRSGWRNTDFLLLELAALIPDSLNLFYNGWDRNLSPPTGRTYCVHHPSGDIKKFSADETGVTTIHPNTIQWNNTVTTPANHHLKMKPSRGIFEVGSSGCGLFNQQKRLVGNFHGGDFNQCSVTGAYFGRFALSWEGGGASWNSLKSWLDPKNKGNMTLDGIEKPTEPVVVNVSAKHPGNKALGFVAYLKMETSEGLVFEDSLLVQNGSFQLRLPTYVEYLTIRPWLDVSPKNGVSVSDIVAIQKHILTVAPFAEEWQKIAADANNSNTISVADMVDIRKLILTIIDKFPKSESWRFNVKFAPPNTLQNNNAATLIVGNAGIYAIEFQGVKIGDVNRSY